MARSWCRSWLLLVAGLVALVSSERHRDTKSVTIQPTRSPSRRPTYSPSSSSRMGFVFVSGDDTDHHVGRVESQLVLCSHVSAGYSTPKPLDNAMARILGTCLNSSGITSATKDILALGVQKIGYSNNMCQASKNSGHSDAWVAFTRWVGMAGSYSYDIVTDASVISSINFLDYRMIYLPSQKTVAQCSKNFDYLLCDIESNLTARKADIQSYVNDHHGSIFSLEQTLLK